MSCESFQDRQTYEIEALKSIFGDELCDLRSKKNKRKWQPLDVIITLMPQKGMSDPAYVQIDLHITCTDRYPVEVPSIELKNSSGLSNQQVNVLYNELVELTKRLQGEVMILELAQHVQNYLYENNKRRYNSFYEEMVSRRQKKIECEMLEKQLKEDKERQVLQDEVQKRQEALKAELRNRKESVRLSDGPSDGTFQSIPLSSQEKSRIYSRRRCASTSESFDSFLCEHTGTKLLRFDHSKDEREVYRARCMGHSTKGSVVYAGVDTTSGELFIISEWMLKTSNKTEESSNQHVIKQIGSLEQEVNHLYKLHHPNLVRYLNMKYLQDEDAIIIYILQEFVVGTSCSFFLLENIPVDIDLLRYLATGVLYALRYLHENNVVHKDLRDTSIYIDRTGMVKLLDYSLSKRLSDMYQSCTTVKTVPDFPTIQSRGGKKADIYRFGALMYSLLNGIVVSGDQIDPAVIKQLDLQDFLLKCLESDERRRWSAEQLLNHSFIKTPVIHALSPPKIPRRDEQKSQEPEEPDTDIRQYVPLLGSHSRITNEFEILDWLGSGAFGEVLKVKNKLDGCIYAIKRIELNPKNKQLNRKITREVKLLSRMNHENVVRYYNSWIENSTITDKVEEPLVSVTPSEEKSQNSLDHLGTDDIEKLAPPVQEVEWNISYKSRTNATLSADSDDDNSDASSDSDSDEDCAFLMQNLLKSDTSDNVEFEKDTNCQATTSVTGEDENGTEETIREKQFMYIQMEFCEKSTLRTAIDGALHKDQKRVWRLFREIVEGLAHIHQQGMIHRDLKPMNIFLDSNDHVKIGDFGLATNILSTFVQTIETDKESQGLDKGISFGTEDVGSLTGQVGTALYVAPELTTKAAKAIYNQKVDIYSLGIIFFEMCYKPLTTGMERIKVLLSLRSKEIILPAEMQQADMSRQTHILRWLLNHDPSQRPTAQELLTSKYLPPPPLEETELQEMIRRTLSNNQNKAYKYLISTCFMQEVSPADDITYDMNVPSRGHISFLTLKKRQEGVKCKVIEIFQRHGGVYLGTPLLMPKSHQFCSFSNSSVKLMTRKGNIVCIPHDLRAPFARYIVWNNIPHIRRYAIERVFREKKGVLDLHPRELYECAFDIISPIPNNLLMEAELIYIVWEIINELSLSQERNFTICLNHTSLLQAVLMYCGIDQEKYQDIYSILRDARDGKFSRFQIQTHFISLCLTDQAMETLFNLFESESPLAKIQSILKTITKRKGDAAKLAKEGLEEIEVVMEHIEVLGAKWPVVVMPLLVHNINQHSGIIYQITYDVKKRRKKCGEEVIAAGGRYDKMLFSFKKILEHTEMASKEIKQYGAGISISLEKLISVVSENAESQRTQNVAIACMGDSHREKEMIGLLKELWSLGLKVTILDLSSVEEILEHCRENLISQVILLKSGEKGSVRIQSWERDRFQEKKITTQEISEFFQRLDNSVPALNRSESKTTTNDSYLSNNSLVNININFISSEKEKVSGNSKRSLKNSMLTQMSAYFQRISHKVPIEIFAVFLDMSVIRTIISFLEIDQKEQDFLRSVQVIIDKHPKHKKYIIEICEEMQEARKEKQRPVVILYSLMDNQYMTLL